MHVVAKDNDGQEISFFVFDLQGTLLQNFKMKGKDKQQITGLAKGRYRIGCLPLMKKRPMASLK